MARINLLPWRDELRKERQKQFQVMAALAAALMIAIILLVHIRVSGIIDNQLSRNKFLETKLKVLDDRIKEIKDLEKEKTNLLARMTIIQQLQGSRPQVVHVFDELVNTLPDGVYLVNIRNTGNAITLDGFAQSNARVSSYMRKIDSAGWLANPKLNVIETQDQKGQRISKFVLNVQQSSPKANNEDREGAK